MGQVATQTINLENLTSLSAICPSDAHDKILARDIHHASAHEKVWPMPGAAMVGCTAPMRGAARNGAAVKKRRAVMKNSFDVRDRLARFSVFGTGDRTR
ncbi:MAG: hypothetical protein V4530_14455 [Pseudomonadota bacterium]